jgi:hypothetical protein
MAITSPGLIIMENTQPNIQTTAPVSNQPKVLRALAHIISYIFHPVFMTTLITVALYQLAPVSFAGVSKSEMGMLLIRIAYTTIFFPLLTMLLLKGLGFIESIHMHDLKDRIIPLIAIMIYYFWAYQVAKNSHGSRDIDYPFILRVLLLGSFWAVICLFMISIFVKISMHTAGMGGLVGILLVLMISGPVNMIVPFFIALVLAGLVGTARLILNAHTPAEIWLGYIIGILVQLGAYFYLV